MYHNIGESRTGGDPSLTISSAQFELQLKRLRRFRFSSIRPSMWLDWITKGAPLPPRPVLLTFDDGFADTARYGFPLLKKYGFTAIMFVVTSAIGGSNEWDEALGWVSQPLMTADEIRRWSREGIEFGSHTHTHPDLRELTVKQMREELCKSRDALAALIDQPVECFAYPFGYYNETVVDMTRQVFRTAFTCDEGLNSGDVDALRLRRSMVVPEHAMFDPLLHVSIGFNPLPGLRRAGVGTWRHLKSVGRRLASNLGNVDGE
jgi:peptidoglycan/xylan/chitin deacetylase (PgdA/CDA1 family)